MKSLYAAVVCALLPGAAFAASLSATITVTVVPVAQSITLSKTAISTGPLNAGVVIGSIAVATNPAAGDASGITLSLSGADAAKFTLSSAKLPATLNIGTANLPGGTYNVTVSATP